MVPRPDAEDLVQERIDGHAVHQALWQLPDDQRIAVTLVDVYVGPLDADTLEALIASNLGVAA
jgi:hypothetical protein